MLQDTKIEDIISKESYYACTTVGRSMFPLLRNKKDVIVIKKNNQKLKKYDVPLYIRGNEYVLHRIIKVKPDRYIIRGDNCMEKEVVTDDMIIGVLSEISRRKKNGEFQKINMNGLGYKLYCSIWNKVFFLRFMYRKIKTFLHKK